MVDDPILTMDRAILLHRNLAVSSLAAALGVPVRLSDEQDPEEPPPYGYYSFITPYASSGEMGNHVLGVVLDPETQQRYLRNVREEQAEMHLSFTFCSRNRQTADGSEILGENEAMQMAMQGAGWFQHEGKGFLSMQGLAVLRVGNLASRSGILADEYIRRWGFDVAIRYKAMTVRIDDIIESTNIYHKKKEGSANGT